jgi:hypothetical protein
MLRHPITAQVAGRKRSEPDAAPSCYDVTATKALRVGAGLSAILHALAGRFFDHN